jgi:two-component sensor histidine kinase
VQEKEWLLKEIPHRVKNNLHTVVSLLESQTAYLDNEALHAVRESRNRVYAMSLIHQKLYQTDNMGSIDLSVYLPELVSNLRDCFDTDQRIDFDIQVIPYEIEVAQAVPLGLILNEAITNCIKYAFTAKHHNRILISMEELDNNYLQLVIADNGKGLPDGFNSKPKRSLGMRLMHGLTGDINGTFDITSDNGTRITITFPPTILFRMSEAIVA